MLKPLILAATAAAAITAATVSAYAVEPTKIIMQCSVDEFKGQRPINDTRFTTQIWPQTHTVVFGFGAYQNVKITADQITFPTDDGSIVLIDRVSGDYYASASHGRCTEVAP